MNNIESEITPKNQLFDFQFKEILKYKDLLFLFVKRDITVSYKQTILGPMWFFIQPLLTMAMYILVFNKIAGISTDGIPPVVFYLAGISLWQYFANSFRLTSNTFLSNAGIFGKVYFPRVIVPLSVVISNLARFFIQFLLFVAVFIFYMFSDEKLLPNFTLLFLPIYILILALLALGFGLAVSALTTKYRDFTFLIQFGVQLWMYATPIIYPISKIPMEYQSVVMLNPVSGIVEAFKYSFTGSGYFSIQHLLYSAIFAVTFLLISLAIFNKTEKNFMDTV